MCGSFFLKKQIVETHNGTFYGENCFIFIVKIFILMDKYFHNKYRIPTNRLIGFDYGSNAFSFVTICTKNRVHYFGEIINNYIRLPPIGQIAIFIGWKSRNIIHLLPWMNLSSCPTTYMAFYI